MIGFVPLAPVYPTVRPGLRRCYGTTTITRAVLTTYFSLVELSVQPCANQPFKMSCPKCLDLHPCWLCSKGHCRLGKGRLLRWNPSSCGPCIDLATMCTSLVMADIRKATEGSRSFTKGLSASLKKGGCRRLLARLPSLTSTFVIPSFPFGRSLFFLVLLESHS